MRYMDRSQASLRKRDPGKKIKELYEAADKGY